MATPVTDLALTECFDCVRRSIEHLNVQKGHLRQFVEVFRGDFEASLQEQADIWARDKYRVLSLCRSIGALAEFLATIDGVGEVEYSHLKSAFEKIGPYCHFAKTLDDTAPNGRVRMFREYCRMARP